MKFSSKLLLLALLPMQVFALTPKTLNINSFTGQVIIAEPGKYVLSEDIAVAPRSSNSAMVYIASSDVYLDLNGKSLTLSATNNMPVLSGIWIADEAEDITITNGYIKGQSVNNLSTAVTSTGIYGNYNKNVVIERVVIDNCTDTGIILDNSWKASIAKTKIKNSPTGVLLQSSRDATLSDLALTQVNSGVIANNCNLLGLSKINVADSSSGAVTGFSFDNCAKVVGANLKVQNNLGAGAKTGFELSNSTRCAFTLCDFLNNICDDASNPLIGFSTDELSDENKFDRCSVRNNFDRNAGNEIYGFSMIGGHYNTLNQCSILDNTSTSTIYGVECDYDTTYYKNMLGGIGLRVEACKILNNTTGIGGEVYGILAKNLSNSSIHGCEISGNGCFSPLSVNNVSAVAAIALWDSCSGLRITDNLMVGNSAYRMQYGFIDQGSTSDYLSSEPTDSSQGIFFYGNSAVHHGPQALGFSGQVLRANFLIQVWSGYYEDYYYNYFPSSGYSAQFAQEIVIDPTTASITPSTELLYAMPKANVSMYVAGANGASVSN